MKGIAVLLILAVIALSAPAYAGALNVMEITDPEAVELLCGLEGEDIIDYSINGVEVSCLLSRRHVPELDGNVYCNNERAYLCVYFEKKRAVYILPRACRWLYAHEQYEAYISDTPGYIEVTLESHEYGDTELGALKPRETTYKFDCTGEAISLIAQDYHDIYKPEDTTPEIKLVPSKNPLVREFADGHLEHVYSDRLHTIRFITGLFELPSFISRHATSNCMSLIVTITENTPPFGQKAYLIREGAYQWSFQHLNRGQALPVFNPDTRRYGFLVYNLLQNPNASGSPWNDVEISLGMDGMNVTEEPTKD